MEYDYPLKANVVKHVQRFIKENSDSKTHYVIEVSSRDINGTEKTWCVEHVFEEFEELNAELKKRNTVPKLPSKGFFSSKTPEELNRRREGLDLYISDCMKRQQIKNDYAFTHFIKLLHQSELSVLKTTLIDKFQSKQTTHDLTNIIQLPNDIFYIVANNPGYINKQKVSSSYFNILERVDQEIPMPGQLFGFKFVDNLMTRLDSIDLVFDSFVTFVYHSDDYLFIGLSTGKLYFIQITEEKLAKEFAELKLFKTSEIVGIGVHEDFIFVFSSKKMKVASIKTKAIVSERIVPFETTAAHYIKEKCLFILGNSAGNIIAVSPITNTFRILAKVSGCIKNSRINTIHLEGNSIYSGSKEGYIGLTEISDSNDGFSLSVTKLFKAKLNVQSITCCENKSLVIVCEKSGLISFFNMNGDQQFTFSNTVQDANKVIIFRSNLFVSSKEGLVSCWKINEKFKIENSNYQQPLFIPQVAVESIKTNKSEVADPIVEEEIKNPSKQKEGVTTKVSKKKSKTSQAEGSNVGSAQSQNNPAKESMEEIKEIGPKVVVSSNLLDLDFVNSSQNPCSNANETEESAKKKKKKPKAKPKEAVTTTTTTSNPIDDIFGIS